TGGEALYADMGHFGARPIRIAWFTIVFPALLINYFGQGALMLRNPGAFENPFFLAAPPWALYPLVGLAAFATVIASQAVISGAFSLTRQAVQLGYLPRLMIRHTSAREIGQIYIPSVNWLLMICAVGLVIAFQASTRLAATQMEASDLLRDHAANLIPRVPGTAIFMSRRTDGIPTSLLHHLKHNKVVHKHVVLLSVVVEEIARLPESERIAWEDLGQG